MKLRHVAQREPYGCGVACLAMIAGITYDEALADFDRHFRKEGMTRRRLDRALARRGFAVARLKARRQLVGRVNLIETCNRPGKKRYHWIVITYDRGEAVLFDPDTKRRAVLKSPEIPAAYKHVRCVSAVVRYR